MILLGSYTLDVEEMVLSINDQKHVLEPKVLEVLLYFIDNSNRYLTMEELHDNVWAGRVVSDAAVRRIISKLRILFHDDHKTPSYIKSLPKRGYKLICNVSYDDDLFANAIPSLVNNTVEDRTPLVTSTQSDKARNESESFRKRVIKKISLFVFLFLIVGTIYAKFYIKETAQSLALTTSEVIPSLPGFKLAVSQSADRQFLAFSGRVDEEQNYQIYIKKDKVHSFIPAPASTFLPASLAFSSDIKSLFYFDFKEGDSSLNRISLLDSQYENEQLLVGYFSIAHISTSSNTELVYFSGKKKKSEPLLIYSYHLNTNEIRQITHSTEAYYSDIKGSISANGELLVFVRYSEFDEVNEVRVIDLNSNNIIYRRNQKDPIYDLKWLSARHLLFLDEKQLVKIDIDSGNEERLVGAGHKLSSLHILNQQKLLAVNHKKSSRIFFDKSLPFNQWSDNSILSLPSEFYYINHLDDNSILVTSNKGKLTILGKFNTQSNELEPYLETEYELKVIEYTGVDQNILIKIDHRFALLNIVENKLRYITYGDEFVGDASFSSDKKSVLFSVKSFEQWEVKKYNLKDETTTSELQGFRYIRPFKNNYIVADNNGNLFFYNNSTQEQLSFGYKMLLDINTQWTVHNNSIYWSSHDLVTTTFCELDINEIDHPKLSQKTFNFDKVSPYFRINSDTSSLIYSQQRQKSSDIVSLTIN